MTIKETLDEAFENLSNDQKPSTRTIGHEQLRNCITLINKGYPIQHDIDNVFMFWGNCEDAPIYGQID